MKVKLSGIWWAVIALIPSASLASLAQAQTESVLYSFTGPGMGQGGNDGSSPVNLDLIRDTSGNLYGTTEMSGTYGSGAVFELVKSSQGYTEKLLYSFVGTFAKIIAPDCSLRMNRIAHFIKCTPIGQNVQSTPDGSGWRHDRLEHRAPLSALRLMEAVRVSTAA